MNPLTVGELVDAAMRVRQADLADLCEIDLQRLVADSQLLAEFVLIVLRDPEGETIEGRL